MERDPARARSFFSGRYFLSSHGEAQALTDDDSPLMAWFGLCQPRSPGEDPPARRRRPLCSDSSPPFAENGTRSASRMM